MTGEGHAAWRRGAVAVVALLTVVAGVVPATAVGVGGGTDAGTELDGRGVDGRHGEAADGGSGPGDGEDVRDVDVGVAERLDTGSISDCRRIESAGVYELTADRSAATTGTCLAVNASDVTIEGNGHALTGNGSGTAVGVVRSGLSNVTVRDLTVRDWSQGVLVNDTTDARVTGVDAKAVGLGLDAGSTTGATVANVSVGIDAGNIEAGFSNGILAGGSTGLLLRNARVESTGLETRKGLGLGFANDVRVENVTLRGGQTRGLAATKSGNLTFDGLRIEGFDQEGIYALGATGLDVRDATIRDVGTGITFVSGISPQTPGTTESGTFANVSLAGVSGTPDASPTYLRVDGTNALTFKGLSTPNATLATFDPENVTLAPVGATPEPPRNATIGRVNVTDRGVSPAATVGFSYPERRVVESTVEVRRAQSGRWSGVPDGSTTLDAANDTATVDTNGFGTYGAFADATDLTGCRRIEEAGVYPLAGDLSTATAGSCLAVNASDVTIEGNGHALTGNGSGTAVGVVRSGLSNVTVRDLTVREWSTGIAVNDTTDARVASVDAKAVGLGLVARSTTGATVTDVSVGIDAGNIEAGFSNGVLAGSSIGLRLRDTRVESTGLETRQGLALGFANDARVENVTLRGGQTRGLATTKSGNLTFDGLRVEGFDQEGIYALGSTGLTVRNATVRDVGTGITFVSGISPQTPGTTESGTFANVSLGAVSGTFETRAAYLRVDGTNALTFEGLSTPNATLASLDPENVTLAPVGATPEPPRNATIGRVNVTDRGASPAATVGFAYSSRVVESTVTARRVQSGRWATIPDGATTLDASTDVLSVDTNGFGTYGAFADATDLTGCRRIEEAGVYPLAGDVSVAPDGTCLAVNASDVTIEGNGHALTGNGSGTAVGVVREGLSNVTVRDLTVRDWSQGVLVNDTTDATLSSVDAKAVGLGLDAGSSTGATVTDVSVGIDAGNVPVGFSNGILAGGSTGLLLRDVRVASTGLETRKGLGLGFANDVRAENVTLRGGQTRGLAAAKSGNLTFDGLRVEGFDQEGIYALGSTGLTVRNATIRDVGTGITFVSGISPQTPGTTESGTFVNVSLGAVSGTFETRAAYLRVDGTNALTFEGLSTPNATLATFDPENVTLAPIGATPAPPRDVTVGRVNVTAQGASPEATLRLRYDADRVREPTVGGYLVDGGGWTPAPSATVEVTADAVRFDAVPAGTYGAFADPPEGVLVSCTVVDAPGEYRLAENVTARAGSAGAEPCLGVNASDVTIEGAGHAVDAGGDRPAVGVVREGLSNVTVRNLTVRDATTGVGLNGTSAAAVRTVTVRSAATGVALDGTADARLRAVSVRNATGSGLTLGAAIRLDARDVTVRDAAVGVAVDRPASGTLANAAVRGVGQPFEASANASNLSVAAFETPNGTVSFAADRAGLASVGGNATPAVADGTVETTIGRFAVTGDPGGRLAATVPYGPSVNDSNVSLYRLDPTTGDFTRLASVGGANVTVDATNDTLSAPLVPGATYGVLEVADAGPACPDAGAGAGSRDLDDDGRCEDLDGNGRFEFLDVVTLLFADWAAINDDPSARPLFDFDGNGKVDFLDVVTLLFEL